MFCLRSWIPVLFFLLRTHASPIYLLLFISATYFLNRPCVYCSLLLFILVVALFDFQAPWFDAPLAAGEVAAGVNGTTLAESAIRAVGESAKEVIGGVVEGVKERIGAVGVGVGGKEESGSEWVRGLLGRREWKIGCWDVLIRV